MEKLTVPAYRDCSSCPAPHPFLVGFLRGRAGWEGPQSQPLLLRDSDLDPTQWEPSEGAPASLPRGLLAAGCHRLPYHVPQTAVPRGAQGAELQEKLCRHLPFSGEGRGERQSGFVGCVCGGEVWREGEKEGLCALKFTFLLLFLKNDICAWPVWSILPFPKRSTVWSGLMLGFGFEP